MDPERWRQIEELYHAARECAASDRPALLAQAGPEVRGKVEALLAQQHSGKILDRPAADLVLDSTVTQIAAGAQLGPYKIEAQIGAGGMGEVYRAIDTRLGRKVAVKLSAREYSNRFEREARAISALNHPHICTLHDIGPNYLVMELCEGETLAARLKRGPLSLDQTLQYGAQIAGALSEAHLKGITHRDLKPGNVMITRSGVKVLDFGLARSSGDDTITASNVVMGTPAYMAPEQREGKLCDARTDIYALGLMLFEMANGKRATQGQTPELDQLPERFAHLIERCLALDPHSRWQSAKDLELELEWAGRSRPAVRPSPVQSPLRRLWPLFGAAVVLVLTFVIASRISPTIAVNYSFSPFATEAAEENYPSWAPDGKTIAYFAENDGIKQIFTKSLGSATPAQITKSTIDCTNPFWSPDGSRLYYLSAGLWSVGAAGGEPRSVIANAHTAAVSSRNTLALIRGPGGSMSLWVSPTNAIEPVQYRQSPFPQTFARSWTVDFSRDGSNLAVLMEREGAAGFTTELWIVPFPTGSPRRVSEALPFSVSSGPPNHRISWLPDNRHLVVDASILSDSGNHLSLIDTKNGSMRTVTSGTTAEWAPSVSPDGEKIAFSAGRHDFDIVQVSLDASDIRTLLGTSSREGSPAWSPSGRQFAYVSNSDGGPELWIRSVQEGWAAPVLRRGAEGLPPWFGLERPIFSPDGAKIAYGADGSKHAIWISPVGGGRPVPLDSQSYDQHGAAWSPDGNWIAYQRFQEGKWEVVKVPFGGGQPVRLAPSAAGGGDTVWSPTGEWLAFARGGSLQLVSSDGKIQRTLTSGSPAFGFSKDGSQMYLIRRGPTRTWELRTIGVVGGNEQKVGDLRIPASAIVSGFSLHPDGKSFLTSVGISKFDIWLLNGLEKRP